MEKQLLRLRRLADVPRWAVIPTIRKQTVAEHSFHVATLCTYIGPMHRAVATEAVSMGAVLESALRHDEIESIVGDTPAPVKPYMEGASMDILAVELGLNEYGGLREIKEIVKMADIAEAVIFLYEEMALGNRAVGRVYENLLVHFATRWVNFDYRQRKTTEPTVDRAWKPNWRTLLAKLHEIYNPRLHPALDHLK